MANRTKRNIARKPLMAERRARQDARTVGFTPIMKTRGTPFRSQTVVNA